VEVKRPIESRLKRRLRQPYKKRNVAKHDLNPFEVITRVQLVFKAIGGINLIEKQFGPQVPH